MKFTNSSISKLNPKDKDYEVTDVATKGLSIRVRNNNKKTYCFKYTYKEKRKRITIGDINSISLVNAQNQAKKYSLLVLDGYDPAELRKERKEKYSGISFYDYIHNIYLPYYYQKNRDNGSVSNIIKKDFKVSEKAIDEINKEHILWIIDFYYKKGNKASSIERKLTFLRGAFRYALDNKYIKNNIMKEIKNPEYNKQGIIRYLNKEEKERLLTSISEYTQPSGGVTNAEMIKTIIHIAMNTGGRRGEILKLSWNDIDLIRNTISFISENTKSNKTRYIPINAKLKNILLEYKSICKGNLLFENNGVPIKTIGYSWKTIIQKAQIENFRFHDLRHDFASQLVMKGVDLNTVRELLGHSDLKMTLRYAHLAPEHLKSAVDLL